MTPSWERTEELTRIYQLLADPFATLDRHRQVLVRLPWRPTSFAARRSSMSVLEPKRVEDPVYRPDTAQEGMTVHYSDFKAVTVHYQS